MTQILVFSLLCAVLGVLLPVSAGDGVRKSVAFLAGLAVLLTVARPVVGAAEKIQALPERLGELLFPVWEEGEEIYRASEERSIQQGIRNAERGIEILLRTRWQIPEGDVHVHLDVSEDANGEIILDCAEITLAEDADADGERIRQYISELLLCPCRVMREKGEDR